MFIGYEPLKTLIRFHIGRKIARARINTKTPSIRVKIGSKMEVSRQGGMRPFSSRSSLFGA